MCYRRKSSLSQRRAPLGSMFNYLRASHPSVTFDLQRTKRNVEHLSHCLCCCCCLYCLTAGSKSFSGRTKCLRATNGVPETETTKANVATNWRGQTASGCVTAFSHINNYVLLLFSLKYIRNMGVTQPYNLSNGCR